MQLLRSTKNLETQKIKAPGHHPAPAGAKRYHGGGAISIPKMQCTINLITCTLPVATNAPAPGNGPRRSPPQKSSRRNSITKTELSSSCGHRAQPNAPCASSKRMLPEQQ
ncbi:hypothetical protein PoB_002675900 [Plakobranchus ocellatus]|uniref:Uncharacterized protein n=1 Tax=Plakobranchus ocellatus TaxID=259542 RepID=A0AAV4A216_9GAST|nr:hypothetical protein PoB_002675900 [Plakobranchus ocellatus]